ncbi:hypothetical protein ACU8V7_03510 [Zobellia nedashkovskayae]
MFVENSEIKITVDLNKLPSNNKEVYADKFKDAYKTVIVEGSSSHLSYIKYKDELQVLIDKKDSIFGEYFTYLNPTEEEEEGKGICF